MKEVAIISAMRTAIGRATKGGFKDTRPDMLAGHAVRAAVERAGVEPAEIEDVVMGCAFPEGEQGMNVGRGAAALAGLPFSVPAMTVNRLCASSLQALSIAANRIRTGEVRIAVAAGVESMSMVPMRGNKFSPNPELVAAGSQLYIPMGQTAEIVAKRFGVTRDEQDALALRSQHRAAAATDSGAFAAEILPVVARVRSAETGETTEVTVAADEGFRRGLTLEALAKLKPVFDPEHGTVTAGNSSQISDGAAACVAMDADLARSRGLEILGLLREFVTVGVEPEVMGIGPVPAVRKLLSRTGLTVADIDLVEINEAFASQAVYCMRELELDPERSNVHGGAIAIGHPLGATGVRLVTTLLHAMRQRSARRGIATLCIGGGQGAAALFERA